MAVIGQAEILLTANTASFTQAMDTARSVSQRTARQIERDQQAQAQARLQIERQYASEHRRVEMDLANELQRIRSAGFSTADQDRYLAHARANAQAQVDAIAEQERATAGYADKAKTAYGYIAAAVGAAAVAVGALVKEQIEMTNELTKTAYIANTSVANIQKYVVAAKGMGIETEKLGDIFKDTQDKVGDFLTTGGGEMKDFFDNIAPQVGVTAKEFRNLSGPDALQLYFDSLQKANLSQSEMVFYMESIADEASALIPYLQDGGKGFDLWAKAAENAGAMMDEKTIRATQELQTSTDLLNLSVKGAKIQIASAFMPVLRDLATELVKDATFKDKAAAAGQGLAKTFKVIAMTGVGVVAIVTAIGKAIGGAMAALAQFGRVAEGVDFTSPFAMFQIGKNVLWNIPKSQLEILQGTVFDIAGVIKQANGTMDWINKLGTNPSGSNLVGQLTDQHIQSEKYKNATGKTGKEQQDERDAAKKAAQEREKSEKQRAKSSQKGIGDYQLAVYDAWKKAGLSDQQAKIMTAEVGRENSYNPNVLFGYHYDAANGAKNAGMLSWQKDRATNLEHFLKSQGLLKNGKIERSQNALDAMAKFAINEIMTNPRYARTKNQFLANPNIDTQTAFAITGDNYIKWDRSGKAVLGATGAAKHAARRDNYYRQISAKAGLVNTNESVKDFQRDLKSEEDKAKQQADARYNIEKQFADKKTQLLIEYQAKVKEIEAAGFDDAKKQQYLAQAKQNYDNDALAYETAQQQKLNAFNNFKRSEREIIEEEYYQKGVAVSVDKELTAEQKVTAIKALVEERDLKLKSIDLTEAKEKQAANAAHQTKVENIRAEAQLQRDEVALNLKLDADLRQAKLNAINENEQEALRQARTEFETELAGINDYAKTELQKLRDEYRGKRSALDARTDISDAQKSDLRNALAGSEIYFASQLKNPHADAFNNLNAEMSGTTELLNLQNQLDQRLEIIKKAKENEVIATEQAEKAKAKVEHDYWYASYQLQVSQSASIADNVANMGKIMFGETSSSYKRLFALSQSFVMAQAGLNMYKAISDGWAQGATLPQKLAAAATAGTEMLKIITAAQQIKMQGFATGGYTGDMPANAVAGWVHGGEYVFDAEATRKLGRKNLDSLRKGDGIGGNTNVTVNVTVNSDGSSSVESQQQLGKNLGDAINVAVQQALIKERRQGGLLAESR